LTAPHRRAAEIYRASLHPSQFLLRPSPSPLTFKSPHRYNKMFILIGNEICPTRNTRNESANYHIPRADSGIQIRTIEQSRNWIRRKAILDSAEVIYAA